MKKDYVQPTMKVFNISADERIAANCMVTHNQNTDWCQTAEHFGVPLVAGFLSRSTQISGWCNVAFLSVPATEVDCRGVSCREAL